MTDQLNRFTRVLARSLQLSEQELLNCFRPAVRQDIAGISSLRRRVFGAIIRDDDETYLQWRYFERPKFESTLWVFEYQGSVIGALGTEPVEVWYDNQLRPALRNMDAIVEPEFDSRGLGAWMTLFMQSKHDMVLVSGGNDKSTSMLKKLFTPLAARNNYKIIFDSNDFIQQKLNNRFFSRLLAPAFNFLAWAFLSLRWRSYRLDDGLTLKYYDRVDSWLGLLGDPVGKIGDIKVVRTAEYLKWRYADNPCETYRSACLFRDDKLLAYVVYKFEDGWGSGSTRMGQIIDWQLFEDNASIDVLTSILIVVLKDLKRRRCHEVMLVLSDQVSQKAALAAGFVFRYVDPLFFVFDSTAKAEAAVYSATAWYHSLGDTDTV